MSETYAFRTPVGVLWIRPQLEHPGRFHLGVDDEILGSYHSAEAAADDVAGQHMGSDMVDSLPHGAMPRELSDWVREVRQR